MGPITPFAPRENWLHPSAAAVLKTMCEKGLSIKEIGNDCFLGEERISHLTSQVLVLIQCVTWTWSEADDSDIYTLTATGKAVNARPELAEEIDTWIRHGRGQFVVNADNQLEVPNVTTLRRSS